MSEDVAAAALIPLSLLIKSYSDSIYSQISASSSLFSPDPLPDLHISRHKEKLATLKNETLLWVPDRSETEGEGKGMERCWEQELQPVTIFLRCR